MPRNRRRLMQLCEECMDSFNPNIGSLDGHIESFCKENAVASGPDQEFLSQVVYGCSRYSGLVETVARVYTEVCHRMQSDRTKFKIIAYLALVRLGQPLSPAQLKKLLLDYVSYSILAELLALLFRPGQARVTFTEGLRACYSEDFLEDTVFPHLEKHAQEMEEVIQYFEDQAKGPGGPSTTTTQKAQSCSVKKPITVPEPFHLAQPF